MEIQVGCADMASDPFGRLRYDQARHSASDDRQMLASERAAKGPEHIGRDPKQPLVDGVVVAVDTDVITGHG